MPTPDTQATPDSAKPATPIWKIALVPVLAIVLAWNLLIPSKQPLDAAATEQTASEVAASETSDEIVPTKPMKVLQQDQRAWPTISADTIAEFDPFALSGELAQRSIATLPVIASAAPVTDADAAQKQQQIKEAVARLNVQGIFKGSNGPAALVDSRIVRIGDEIEPGLRIVQITASGIVVEPVKSL